MADISFLSDSDDDVRAAADELLSQAMDHYVLEQVAAINCSGFADSPLPSHLESRFRKLKSFPSANPKPPNLAAPAPISSAVSQSAADPAKEDRFEGNRGPEKGSISDFVSSPPKLDLPERKFGSGSFSSSDSSASTDPPSPPAKTGCLWCSPRKKNKGKENRGAAGKRFLSDLNSFSEKKQEKMLKKAMKEGEKISREAEKIVKWAKQASARMEFAGLDEDDDDDVSGKELR